MNLKRKIKKITVRFPQRLKNELQIAIINSGYGCYGKSRWLKEAINVFLQQPDFVEYVEHGIDINQAELSKVEAFYLDADTIQIMKEAFVKVRIAYPLFEGVQSALIRAAVVYSLMLK
ncbi:MAG TPA: hypothetical protein VHZ76_10060 [Gammaproteobacteria bacterium]|nr:hypothetical protein [Gammaproteobacteria bacterium]